MPNNSTAIPDMSIDFMRWLNEELRKRAERPEGLKQSETERPGLVHLGKRCLSRVQSVVRRGRGD